MTKKSPPLTAPHSADSSPPQKNQPLKEPDNLKANILNQIDLPAGLHELSIDQLKQLTDELRQDMIHLVSKTGGHLGAGLGVVELTIALHSVFNTPQDRLIWDVGHQCYPHKILTGRRALMEKLRQEGGASGFTKRAESAFDPFGAGHSSTAMSAGLGMAVARDLSKGDHHVVCVAGDGAMSAGMAYEAMNNAGALKSKLIVILNDNDMSIAPPVGAMSAYLSRLLSSRPYLSFREIGKQMAGKLPRNLEAAVARAEEYTRTFVSGGGTLFEELGFYYVGPIDGHNLDHLLPVLKNIKAAKHNGPILLHVVTNKGKGYEPAERSADKYHGVQSFDVETGAQKKSVQNLPSYTKLFGEWLTKAADKDDKIIAITAAMPSGTGLDIFEKSHPDRCFDVGIAEQHAVTFAAGLACEGYRPFAALYSTFLQRGYDQVIHDVAIQNLPVRFCIDRAGYVGADGATHCGAFDIGYLASLPNLTVLAPSDGQELEAMLAWMQEYDAGPSAIRYPRGNVKPIDGPHKKAATPVETGKGYIVQKGQKLAIIALGPPLGDALNAAKTIKDKAGYDITIADARFAKPVDSRLIENLARSHDIILTIEEGAIGGFAAQVQDALQQIWLTAGGLAQDKPLARHFGLYMPDQFFDHMSPDDQLKRAGLDEKAIYEKAICLLGLA